MTSSPFLFDSFDVARRSLTADSLTNAVCTAIRLGRNALFQEKQAAFLRPLVEQHGYAPPELASDDYLRDLIKVAMRRPGESSEQFVARVLKSSNLSAVRLVLAEAYQQEYDGDCSDIEETRQRRKNIRAICRALPSEVYSDILQGEIRMEDSDFLARPEFFEDGAYPH